MSDDHFEQQDHVAYANGETVSTVDFDFDAIDRSAPLAAELTDANGHDPFPDLGDCLAAVLHWCWRGGTANYPGAFHRFISLSMVVNPALLDQKSYEQVAGDIGITRAALSKHATELQETYKVQFVRSRSARARESYRRAHLGLKRGHRTSSATPPGKESSK